MVKEVICINTNGFGNSLVLNKIYTVIKEDDEHYFIMAKERYGYYKKRFKVINNDKIYELW